MNHADIVWLEPEQVGRVITRLEANEQMLDAIVARVPEPARPAILRAAEASRPETVAPDEVRVEIRRERLAPAPGLAPTFGPLGSAALVERPALPEFADAASAPATPAPAPTSTPARVQAPVSAATLLPTAAGVGPTTGSITPRGGEPTATPTPPPRPGAPAFTAPAPSPTPAAPAAVPTTGYQILPPVGPSPTPSPGRPPSSSAAREGLPPLPPATPTAAPARLTP